MDALDFTSAEATSFEPLPNGTYDATVFKAEMSETKGTGALPVCPMLKVQFRISDEPAEQAEYANRRVFTQFVIPPKDLDGQPYQHYNTMMGNLMTFFTAVGYDDKDVKKWKKLPDLDDLAGKECRVTLGTKTYNGEVSNEVKRVKPAGAVAESAASGLAGL